MKRLLIPVLFAASLSGCAGLRGDVRPFAPMAEAAAPSPAVAVAQNATASVGSAGGIYGGGGGLRLFEDNKAHDVGDLLTIVLQESTAAKTTATTQVSKGSAISMAAPTVLGIPVTVGGQAILEADVNGDRSFNGKGDSAQTNTLSGNVTVTVIARLANGNLVVQGQKQLRLNQGDELVQIQGIVRLVDISPDNTIPSSRVGEARIAYGGRGTMARSNAMGWLGRFFNSPLFPQ